MDFAMNEADQQKVNVDSECLENLAEAFAVYLAGPANTPCPQD